jgi:hypothetical protein
VQDRYFGDIGDFAKFGLLRSLVVGDPQLRLGVLWYRVPDENFNRDGRHIEYLSPTPENVHRYGRCDPGLYETLGKLVSNGQRGLSLVHEHKILPCSPVFHDDVLSYRSVRKKDRPACREKWITAALAAMAETDLVFADPDNGLEVSVERYAAKGPKYAYYDDFRQMTISGKSLVIYQHACRDGNFCDQIRGRLTALRQMLPSAEYRVLALRFRRVSPRAFLLAISKPHTVVLQQRIRAFLNSPWRDHFEKVHL